jgi:hypothetical protein
LLDQRDERQEVLAVEPVPVEVTRRTVRGGHHRDPLVADQRAEQPAHDHRVGTVVDHHLVEREAPDILGNCRGDWRDRVALFGSPRLAQALVNLEHEGVEVDPALGLDRQGLVEQVHQHRLAASDAAPEVGTAHGIGLAENLEQSARRLGFECALQAIEPFDGGSLVAVGFQFAGFDEFAVALHEQGHRRAIRGSRARAKPRFLVSFGRPSPCCYPDADAAQGSP